MLTMLISQVISWGRSLQWYGDAGSPGTRGAGRGVQWYDVGGTVVRRRGYNGTM